MHSNGVGKESRCLFFRYLFDLLDRYYQFGDEAEYVWVEREVVLADVEISLEKNIGDESALKMQKMKIIVFVWVLQLR